MSGRAEPTRPAVVALMARLGALLLSLGLLLPALVHAQADQPAPRVASAPTALTEVRSVEGITEYRLPNGLQVLLIPDTSKPTTTVNLTYRVGSRHENYGETGMAHLLEHLLFKGTPKHPTVWAEFTKRGLRANGSTWLDRTNYMASFAANEDNLAWYLGWLADAMTNSFIARKDLDSEMTVVRNEMEMGENNPEGILFEKTVAAMYQWHNYGKSTIGARADIENVDIGRLQAFYRLHYQPDNATLIVSGAFDPPKVLRTIGASFGPIAKPSRALPTQYTLDPAQDGERAVTLRRAGGVPLIMAGYHTPPGPHRDFAAIELLTQLLSDVPSGRLHKRLTEPGLAAGVFGWTTGLAEPGFVLFGANLPPNGDVEKARVELIGVLESIARNPVTTEEVERARAKWINGWEAAFTDPEVVGVSLSESIAQGDWRLFFLQRDRVMAASLADVQRVAEQWLVSSSRTLGTYLPVDKPQRAPAPQRITLADEMATFKPQAAAAAVAAFEATPANIDARTQRAQAGPIQMALLPKPTRGQAVQATLTLRFGNEQSLMNHGSVPGMVIQLLDKGTRTMSRQQIQDRLDGLRTQMSVGGGSGNVVVRLVSRREHLPAAIALVGDVLREPSFPPDVLEELRRASLAGIAQVRTEPQALLANAMSRQGNPYPRGDARYARSFDEQVADIQAVNLEAVKAFHQRFYGTGRATFAAVGDFDAVAVQTALTAAFANWRPGEAFARVPSPLVPPKPERFVLTTPDKQNANLLVRLPVPLKDTDVDYPALMLANYLLGSGGNSRLWKRIRETDGLSYDVRSGINWNVFEQNSVWTASAIFAPQNRDKVEAAFRQEVDRALKEGFTPKELDEGKRGLLNFRRLGRAQDDVLATNLEGNLHLGRTFAVAAQVDAALEKLSLDQVNVALRKYIVPAAFVIGVAGDFKAP